MGFVSLGQTQCTYQYAPVTKFQVNLFASCGIHLNQSQRLSFFRQYQYFQNLITKSLNGIETMILKLKLSTTLFFRWLRLTNKERYMNETLIKVPDNHWNDGDQLNKQSSLLAQDRQERHHHHHPLAKLHHLNQAQLTSSIPELMGKWRFQVLFRDKTSIKHQYNLVYRSQGGGHRKRFLMPDRNHNVVRFFTPEGT